MELILLPGNSINNKEWIEKIESDLKEFFDKTYVSYYKHWETGSEIIDMNYELEKLTKHIGKKRNYIILAKSVGAVLTIRGIKEGKLKPKKCIFFGTPILFCRKYGIPIDFFIENYSTETMFIQNTKDPFFSADELRKFLKDKNVKNHSIIEFNGETHNYDEFFQIKKLVKSFV
jgi:hypothetical protein